LHLGVPIRRRTPWRKGAARAGAKWSIDATPICRYHSDAPPPRKNPGSPPLAGAPPGTPPGKKKAPKQKKDPPRNWTDIPRPSLPLKLFYTVVSHGDGMA